MTTDGTERSKARRAARREARRAAERESERRLGAWGRLPVDRLPLDRPRLALALLLLVGACLALALSR